MISFATQGRVSDVYRVIIVDDSAVIRGAIARALEGDPQIKIAASVNNGEVAVQTLQRVPADVMILDIEMPVMDGLEALPHLKRVDPAVQIIMASTLTKRNAETSLKAMSLGATDYIPKPESSGELVSGAAEFKRDLLEKVKTLGALARRAGVRQEAKTAEGTSSVPSGGVNLFPGLVRKSADSGAQAKERPAPRPPPAPLPPPAETAGKTPFATRAEPIVRPDVIAIGSSTGGPQALFRVVKDIGSGLSQPIVITQHMPPSFTSILADHITKQCQVTCAEAKDGEVLEPGRYYVAPGDFHMLIETYGGRAKVRLTKDAQENFCRPAVDPMLRSLVSGFGRRILAVILTGMGQDGTKGCEDVVRAGGSVIAQDEATSVVWGMPGSVAMAGLCSAVLPLDEIGSLVRQNAMRPR